VAYYILGNADQGRICATDVARWDTSFGIPTRPKGMVLVHLEGNDGRTRVKRSHRSFLRHVGSPYFAVKGWVTGCSLYISQLYFVLYLHLLWGFGPKSVTLTKSFVNA
jgi:hypothetical protein